MGLGNPRDNSRAVKNEPITRNNRITRAPSLLPRRGPVHPRTLLDARKPASARRRDGSTDDWERQLPPDQALRHEGALGAGSQRQEAHDRGARASLRPVSPPGEPHLGRFAPTPRAFGATGLTAPPFLPRSPQVDVAALEAQIAEKAARAREEAEYDRCAARRPVRANAPPPKCPRRAHQEATTDIRRPRPPLPLDRPRRRRHDLMATQFDKKLILLEQERRQIRADLEKNVAAFRAEYQVRAPPPPASTPAPRRPDLGDVSSRLLPGSPSRSPFLIPSIPTPPPPSHYYPRGARRRRSTAASTT